MPLLCESSTVSVTVATRVRYLRRQREWSVRMLAERCAEIGATTLTENALENIERGRSGKAIRGGRPITVDELIVFARIFDVSPDDLLRDVDA